MRRNLIPGALALLLVPATVATTLALIPEPLPTRLAFPRPAHRLAVAVDAALRAEVSTVKRGRFSSSSDLQYLKANGRFPTMDQLRLPPDYRGLWLPFAGPSQPCSLVVINEFNLEAKTRDGRDVLVTIRPDPIGEGSVVEFRGEARLAQALAPKIAEQLARPAHPHESDEDRAALIAFFGPRPTPRPRRGSVPPAAPPRNGPKEQVVYEVLPR